MGAVYRPEDIVRRKRMLEQAARDLSPGQLEKVRTLFERWDESSRNELIDLLGEERATRLMKELRIL